MKLRHVFAVFLLLGGTGALVLTLDFNRRLQKTVVPIRTLSSNRATTKTPSDSRASRQTVALKLPPHLLAAYAAGGLTAVFLFFALLLLLPRLVREERRAALLRAGLPPVPPASNFPRPVYGAETTVPAENATDERTSSAGRTGDNSADCSTWALGTISPWPVGESVQTVVSDLAAGWRKDASLSPELRAVTAAELEEFISRADFEAEFSAVGYRHAGRAVGMLLVLRGKQGWPVKTTAGETARAGTVNNNVADTEQTDAERGKGAGEGTAVTAVLWTAPAFRMKGLAGLLTTRLESLCRLSGIRRLTTDASLAGTGPLFEALVRDEETAAFFLSRGWQTVQRICRVTADCRTARPPKAIKEREAELIREGFFFRTGLAGGTGTAAAATVCRTATAEKASVFLAAAGSAKQEIAAVVARLRENPGRFLFAEKEGRFLGGMEIEPPDETGCAGLRFSAVLPEAAGAGLGRVLLARAGDLWRAAGARTVVIRTDPRSAQTFYIPNGFRLLDERLVLEKELRLPPERANEVALKAQLGE